MERACGTTIKKIISEEKTVRLIKEELEKNPSHDMASMARFLCENLNLISANGRMRHGCCVSALRSLVSRGTVLFKKKRSHRRVKRDPLPRPIHLPPLPSGIPDSVEKMADGLKTVLIGEDDAQLKKVWNDLMAAEHPLGEARICGSQLKYLVCWSGGYIAAFCFSCSALKLEARDKWINWSESERESHQSRVLNMSRFLIRKGVDCKNLASHLLSKSLKLARKDFKERYRISPWLVETFVDTEKYSGVCYRASNWIHIGSSKGRGRNDRNSEKAKSVKDIYMYVLEPGFRRIAGIVEPPEPYAPMDVGTGLGASEWAGQEFGDIDLGDRRISKRLVRIASDKGRNPSGSYPQSAMGDKLAMKAYYGFLSNTNEEIDFQRILSGHRKTSIRRAKSCGTVVAVQDSTDLNFSGLLKTAGLGKSGQGKGTSVLMLHSLFLVGDDGLPLGVPFAECTAPLILGRDGRDRNRTPIEEKESGRWLRLYVDTLEISRKCPQTRIVSAMDREADIYELLELACANRKEGPVVIRAQHDRGLENSPLKLFEFMKKSRSSFRAEVNVPPQRARKPGRNSQERPHVPARKAVLEVSYEKVTISPPKTPLMKNHPPLTLHAVYAREINPPMGAEPIKWLLLTTLEIKSPEDAMECLGFYRLRWRIEEFHRVLKTVCGVELHRNGTAEKLKRAIAIDIVTAWRTMLLTLLGRECPQMPANLVFDKQEMLVLNILAKKNEARQGKRK